MALASTFCYFTRPRLESGRTEELLRDILWQQNQQANQFAGAQGLGALGMGMNQGYQNQAQMQNALSASGIGQLMGVGGMQQQQGQAYLDMQRANQIQTECNAFTDFFEKQAIDLALQDFQA